MSKHIWTESSQFKLRVHKHIQLVHHISNSTVNPLSSCPLLTPDPVPCIHSQSNNVAQS